MADDYTIKIGTEVDLNDLKRLTQAFQGFNLELGAMGARFATHLPNTIAVAIKTFGQQECERD